MSSLKQFETFFGDGKENQNHGYAALTNSDDLDDKAADDDDIPPCFIDEDLPDVVAETEINDGNDTLRPGDHVYVWRSFGVPRAYQRHGIVLSIDPDKVDPLDAVSVVSFYRHGEDKAQAEAPPNNQDSQQADEDELSENGNDAFTSDGHDNSAAQHQDSAVSVQSLRDFAENDAQVHKVQYESGVAKRLLRRAGTVTACVADDDKLVLSRVHYLIDHPTSLPKFHVLSANGECAAVWVKLGRWCSLQGSSVLEILAFGQAGGAAAGGVVASNVFFWAPMPGIWGMVGFWWYVPATVAFPILVPLLVTFGLLSIVPLEILRRYRKKWKQITFGLNHEYWSRASQEIKEEFFATSASANEDWMKKFFGVRDKEDDDGAGRYMPLDTTEDDSEDEDMIQRHREHVAACYSADSGTGHLPSEGAFLKQFGSVRHRWRNYCNKAAPISASNDSDSSAAVPLTKEASNDEGASARGPESWWKTRTAAEGSSERESLVEKISNSFTKRNEKEASRTTPALDILDDDGHLL